MRNHRGRRGVIHILSTFFALLLGVVTVQAQTIQPPAGAVPSSMFGMHRINRHYAWPTVPFGSLGKGTAVRWVYIETSKGVYNWANLDRWVNDAATHNMPIFWSNDGVPGWAAADTSNCDQISTSTGTVTSCPSMVRNIADWDSFVTALVTRYKGRIKVYELWNEPHGTFSGTVSQMVTLTNRMYNIIRSIDPGATIVSPSANPSYMDQYWAAGGTRGIDVVSVHGYPFSSVGGSGPAIPETLYSQRAQPIQSIMARYGLSGKPVWDTEGSWGNKAFAATIKDLDAQAAFVARFYLLHWSAGMSRAYWYAWDNNSWGLLWNSTSGEFKPANAYRQTYNWMVGATMPESCKWTGVSAYDAVYTCTLTRANGYQAQAVWNVARTSTYTVPAGFVRYRTLDGNTYSITGSTVTIGPKPILLETGTSTGAPTPVLTVTPQSGKAPLEVVADGTGSYDSNGSIASSTINFGDGSATISLPNASHTYNTPGTYVVTLTVTDNSGTTAKTTKTVIVSSANTAPTAVLAVTPTTGTAPVTISADSSGSSDADGTIVSRSITFGDGSAAVTSTTATHTYSVAGTYAVTLTVTDNAGASSTTTKTVTVSKPNVRPTAVLTATPTTGNAPLNVFLDSSGSYDGDGTIASRTISFGDGSVPVTSTTAAHTFAAGTYTVTLTVKDNSGATSTATKTISVAACGPSTTAGTVRICSPTQGATVSSPVRVVAYATGRTQINYLSLFVDGVKVVTLNGTSKLDRYVTLSPGSHRVTVQAREASGATITSTSYFTAR